MDEETLIKSEELCGSSLFKLVPFINMLVLTNFRQYCHVLFLRALGIRVNTKPTVAKL